MDAEDNAAEDKESELETSGGQECTRTPAAVAHPVEYKKM